MNKPCPSCHMCYEHVPIKGCEACNNRSCNACGKVYTGRPFDLCPACGSGNVDTDQTKVDEAVMENQGAVIGAIASESQIGGSHYSNMVIQPAEFIHKNGIGFLAGNVIKYTVRYKNKGGKQDLEKARHYIDLLIEKEYPNAV